MGGWNRWKKVIYDTFSWSTSNALAYAGCCSPNASNEMIVEAATNLLIIVVVGGIVQGVGVFSLLESKGERFWFADSPPRELAFRVILLLGVVTVLLFVL